LIRSSSDICSPAGENIDRDPDPATKLSDMLRFGFLSKLEIGRATKEVQEWVSGSRLDLDLAGEDRMTLARWLAAGFFVLACVTGSLAVAGSPRDRDLCGTGRHATVCFASVDRAGKLSREQRARLVAAAPVAIDIVSSPEFAAELAALHAALPRDWVARNRYWRDFDPDFAIAATRSSFAGLHIDTVGGVRARLAARFRGNLAYEGSADPRTGARNIRLNRYRLDRPLGALVNTYVHEAAHKGGYSHRGKQGKDQKCEPPYVMGQLAQKLAEPDKWDAFAATRNACRFWSRLR
jgi:hypothetical protein